MKDKLPGKDIIISRDWLNLGMAVSLRSEMSKFQVIKNTENKKICLM